VERTGEDRDRVAALEGEELGTVSRENQVPVHGLKRWRRIFLEGGTNGFKRRDSPAVEREFKRCRRRSAS
jgi:hypothetical protein